MDSPTSTYSNVESSYQLRYNYSKTMNKNFKLTNYQSTIYDDKLSLNCISEYDSNFIAEQSSFNKVISQTNIMLYKNFLLFKRNFKVVLIQLLTPILALLVILMLDILVSKYNNLFINRNPGIHSFKDAYIDNCKSFKGYSDCVTLGYSIINKKDLQENDLNFYSNIINKVGQYNNLNKKDIKLLTTGHYKNINNYFSKNLNKTYYAIIFCHDEIDINGTYYPCKGNYINNNQIVYNIVYNNSLSVDSISNFYTSLKLPYKKDLNILKLKLDMDNAILTTYSELKESKKNKLLNNELEKNDNIVNINYNNNEIADIPIKLELTEYPTTKSRMFENADVILMYGSFYFFFSAIVCFVLLLLELVKEKESKQRKSLIIIGLNCFPYWVSWIIFALFFAISSSLVLTLVGYLMRFTFFTNSNFFIIWLVMFLFNFSMQTLAFFLSTIINSVKLAYTVSYSFVIIGLIIQAIISNSSLLKLLYEKDSPLGVQILRIILQIYPPFSFSKIITEITAKACYNFNMESYQWVKGPGFYWNNLFESLEGILFYFEFKVSPPIDSIYTLIITSALYLILCFYFDHIISENQGKHYKFYFFIQPSYWFRKKYVNKAETSNYNKKYKSNNIRESILSQNTNIINNSVKDNINSPNIKLSILNNLDNKDTRKSLFMNSNKIEDNLESNQQKNIQTSNLHNQNSNIIDTNNIIENNNIGKSVENEKLKIMYKLNSEKNTLKENNFNSLTIIGISKTYSLSSSIFSLCCKSKRKEKKALKPIYLEISSNEIFTIIGHNGAGKTTLINILTKNIAPTSGSAEIYGVNLIEDNLEQTIGLCPQHDILWEELTAKEHLYIYAKIRNINSHLIEEAINIYLKDVNLTNQKNNPVKSYSGGMKRRLSIILSTVGNPKVIFLDEPTTGLDPVNKRFIWKMIQKIKENRSIILTTHAMEEAEYLSDRIGIIKAGQFKCIGTSIELKQFYGAGYLLTFVVNSNNIEEAIYELKEFIPSGKIVNKQGGCIIMDLDINKSNEMKILLELLAYKNNYDQKSEAQGSKSTLFNLEDSNNSNIINPNKIKKDCIKNRRKGNNLLINGRNTMKIKRLVNDCGMDFTTLEEVFIKVRKYKYFNNFNFIILNR